MKSSIRHLVESLNYHFDQMHFIRKQNRKIGSLYNMLLYKSKKYKETINIIQSTYSQIGGRPARIQHRELVACSIAAKCNKNGVFGTSYRMLSFSTYNIILRKHLSKIGGIGNKSTTTGCDNVIGKCAEVKAANNILNTDKKAAINLIEFTRAIRPRTSENINRCNNCISIFGHE